MVWWLTYELLTLAGPMHLTRISKLITRQTSDKNFVCRGEPKYLILYKYR